MNNISKQRIDEQLVKIKNKCKEVNEDFEKCTLIHERLNKVFENKQKICLDNLRKEIREKKNPEKKF